MFGKEGRNLVVYNINGCMLVSGKDFSITVYVMPDDVDHIHDLRYHMRCRTFIEPANNVLRTLGVAWTWMALRARNASPSRRAASTPQSRCHGPRPGLKLVYGILTGCFCATELSLIHI